MKIGIVGGTGLIGRNLTFRLLEIGYSVRILSRFSNIPELLQGKKKFRSYRRKFSKTRKFKTFRCNHKFSRIAYRRS
ncbi:NADH(P)-binding protein, PF13460 domain protein [Leptospira kirschneri serovar Mozdok]|nr:NADH(P)-binding protein, PF13460 domain protein [Leptospira kirschneri serovar Mozdok]